MEIERKYLVTAVPALDGCPATALRQGYLAIEGGVEVRIRAAGGRHTLTVKGGSGLVRVEEEIEIGAERFEALWPLTESRRIEKVRHLVPHGAHTIELDVFGGELTGLVVAEVEFETVAESEAFVAPDWLGDDVTGRPGYANADLARGLPRG